MGDAEDIWFLMVFPCFAGFLKEPSKFDGSPRADFHFLYSTIHARIWDKNLRRKSVSPNSEQRMTTPSDNEWRRAVLSRKLLIAWRRANMPSAKWADASNLLCWILIAGLRKLRQGWTSCGNKLSCYAEFCRWSSMSLGKRKRMERNEQACSCR